MRRYIYLAIWLFAVYEFLWPLDLLDVESYLWPVMVVFLILAGFIHGIRWAFF